MAMLKSNREVVTLNFSVAHLSLRTNSIPEWHPMRCQNDLSQFLFYSAKMSVKSMKKNLSLSRILTAWKYIFNVNFICFWITLSKTRRSHTLTVTISSTSRPRSAASLWRTSREWQCHSWLSKMGLTKNVSWNEPPSFCPLNCPKEEGVPAEHSALPTHTGTRASQAHSWMRHRLEHSRWFHATSWCWEPVTFLWKVPLTHWWQQCPISPSAWWLLPFAQAGSFWGDGEWPSPFQPCWWTASWIFHAIAGCRLLTEMTQLTCRQPRLFVWDGSLQAPRLPTAWQESPKPGHTALGNAAPQPSKLRRLRF